MDTCPFKNENTTCDLSVAETQGNNGSTPKIAHCKQCSQTTFQCASGHWNRAFARFCTQCSQKLQKPAVWGMASANPQHTATLPQVASVNIMDVEHGFGTWVVNTPKIETDQILPGLLAIDGYIIVPNSREQRLDIYGIAKPQDQRTPNLQESIALNVSLTYGSTPIYYGLHLFHVISGGVQRNSVFGGPAKFTVVSDMAALHSEPVPGCAPLKCDIDGTPTMVTGLKHGVLLFDLTRQEGTLIQDNFFSENEVTSPVLCGKHLIFTSQQGGIFSLNIGTQPYSCLSQRFQDGTFSAPVSLAGKVYFEVLSDTGERSFASYEPTTHQLSKVVDLDQEPMSNVARYPSRFVYPPLTDGQRVFLSNRYGQTVYTYDSHGDFLREQRLPQRDTPLRFVPHLSIVVKNRIYSAHAGGLTLFDAESIFAASHQTLAMGMPTNPAPVAPPIRYADKLLILCRDRLLCMDLGDGLQ